MAFRERVSLGLLVAASLGVELARAPAEPSPVYGARAARSRVDALFEARWRRDGLAPAPPAGELTVWRRLSLALHGTVPSLEEIRAYEDEADPDRLARWTARLLDDPRFADYFSRRMAVWFVGTGGGPFLVYRRDRLEDWLRAQLAAGRPYDEIVRDLIASDGHWTNEPATNFLTHDHRDGAFDTNALAGRTVRAFLGQRMDCAQCHDHPFDDWTRRQFEGLAAFYADARLGAFGVNDDVGSSTVSPSVPFGPEWAPKAGAPRRRLAAWLTHPRNRRFARATVNRVWAELFGRPWSAPVDDLPDPGDDDDALDLLARDFRAGGYDLRRLIATIAATRVFRLASAHPDLTPAHQAAWAVFAMTPLRPEQVVGSLVQAATVRTIDRDRPALVRLVAWLRTRDFVKRYGDAGDEAPRPPTLPQALLRMNGEPFQSLVKADFFSAAGRIAAFASGDEACLEALYLAFVTRRPTALERRHFLPLLNDTTGRVRAERVEDIAWALANAPEFSWMH